MRRRGRFPVPAQGFSLLELLAVLVVIGVLSGALLLSADLGGARARHLDQARALAVLVERMCEEATLMTREYGFLLAPPTVRFLSWEGEGWLDRESDRHYRPRQFAAGIRADLRVDGREVTGGDPDTPQVVCWSSGEMTPFELRLESPAGERVTLVGTALGTVSLESGDEF